MQQSGLDHAMTLLLECIRLQIIIIQDGMKRAITECIINKEAFESFDDLQAIVEIAIRQPMTPCLQSLLPEMLRLYSK